MKEKLSQREHIKNSALKVFSEKGYSAATMRDIAAESGTSLGLPYSYFRSKDLILKEILSDHLNAVLEAGKSLNPDERITDQLFSFIKKESPRIRLLWSAMLFPDASGLMPKMLQNMVKKATGEMDGILMKAFPGKDASVTRSFFLGLVLHCLTGGQSFTKEEFRRQTDYFIKNLS